MSSDAIYQLIGYAGSAFIVVSLTRRSILKLRLFGLAGSVTFLVYSLLIKAYPIAVVNVVIIGVHLFFLRELYSKKREFFSTLHVNPESKYLAYFLEFHRDQIAHFQPEFEYVAAEDLTTVFVLRDLVPAGLFIGRPCEDHSMEVVLDFVIPQYRDFKVGAYLYSDRSNVFDDVLCDRAWSEPGIEAHSDYLLRMGYELVDDAAGRPRLEKDLTPLRTAAR